jgi:L-asparagine transporter-like permease
MIRCHPYHPGTEKKIEWAVLLYFLGSLPLISFWFHRLQEIYFNRPNPGGFLSLIPLHYMDFITALMISYWVIWCLIRIPMVNALFTYTTLTHYYRRYHQPETRLKQLGAPKGRPQ